MDWSRTLSRLTLWAFAGGLVGLAVGAFLMVLGVVDNPFRMMSVGIGVGALLVPLRDTIAPPRGRS